MENSTTKFQKIRSFIFSHKKTSIGILICLIVLGYFLGKTFFTPTAQAQYITATVEKGSILVSVTGSGQVEASNSIDLKAKVSSDITYIGVKAGDVVKKGKTLFSLNARDAQKTVRDAEVSLESAELSLQKLQVQNSNENLSADLQKAYDDGFSTVSDTFLDLSSTISSLKSILDGQILSDNAARNSGKVALDYKNKSEELYYQAQNLFQKNRADFRLINRNSPKTDIENIINETYQTTITLSDAIKSIKNFTDYLVEDIGRTSELTSLQTTLSGYTSTIDGHLSSLFTAKTDIKNYKDTSINSNLDIRSSLLSVQQKENSLQDAKNTLSDYYISAPFDGMISSVIAKLGDTASGILATIITDKKLATISLNEVDIAKIKLGQKATLTFDAIEDLVITGEVAEIDSIGTVSQGVVTYNVKISFDVPDERVKPGMSVSATITTDIAQDVLIVPNSAIKSQGKISYVQTFDAPLSLVASGAQGSTSNIPPKQTKVETGLVDDNSTEIISGLKEGDIIVIKIITSTTTAKTATQTPSIFGSMGGSNKSSNSGTRSGGGFAVPHN